MTDLRNVHAGVLREVGSRATWFESPIDRRHFLRGLIGLIAIPFVRRFFPSVDLAPQGLLDGIESTPLHEIHYTSLAEWSRDHPIGSDTQIIIDMLTQQNDILNDMVWMEQDLPPTHPVFARGGLPWRQ